MTFPDWNIDSDTSARTQWVHVLHPSVRGFVLISIPRIAMLFA